MGDCSEVFDTKLRDFDHQTAWPNIFETSISVND